jgi:hypothetical protein
MKACILLKLGFDDFDSLNMFISEKHQYEKLRMVDFPLAGWFWFVGKILPELLPFFRAKVISSECLVAFCQKTQVLIHGKPEVLPSGKLVRFANWKITTFCKSTISTGPFSITVLVITRG